MTRGKGTVAAVAGMALALAIGYVVFGGSERSSTSTRRLAAVYEVSTIPHCQPNDMEQADAAGVTAVLVDRTVSTRGDADAPDYPTLLEPALRAAVRRGDAVLVAGFDGSSATVRWRMIWTAFRGDRNRLLIMRQTALRCAQDTVRAAVRDAAEAPGTDVLGALRSASGLLAEAPGTSRRLIVATDGLGTVGCADLNTVSMGGDAGKVATRCTQKKELADLRGAEVEMLGLGVSASGPAPSSVHLDDLVALWTTLCSATEATCQVVPGISARGANPAPAGSADDPTVRWPEPERIHGPGTVTVSLPHAVLFETDSSELLPRAREALAEVQRTVREVSGSITAVVGHTDARGDEAHNDLLSLSRAQSVATALRGYGIRVGDVRGDGERRPKCSPETRPDGTGDTAAQQCNRRVDVVIRFSGRGR